MTDDTNTAAQRLTDEQINAMAMQYGSSCYNAKTGRIRDEFDFLNFGRAIEAAVSQPAAAAVPAPRRMGLEAAQEAGCFDADPQPAAAVPADLHAAIPTAQQYLSSQFPPGAATSDWMDGWDACRQFVPGAAADLVAAAPSAQPVAMLTVLDGEIDDLEAIPGAPLPPDGGYALYAAAAPSVPAGDAIAKAEAALLKVHDHLGEALRIPTMPWPDPAAHGHEATGRAIHAAFCALRFKVMDAIAALTASRCEVTHILAAAQPAPQAVPAGDGLTTAQLEAAFNNGHPTRRWLP